MWIFNAIQLVVKHLGLKSSNSDEAGHTIDIEELAMTISIEYLILAISAFLIVINVQGFFRRLLVTLKNILRDSEI